MSKHRGLEAKSTPGIARGVIAPLLAGAVAASSAVAGDLDNWPQSLFTNAATTPIGLGSLQSWGPCFSAGGKSWSVDDFFKESVGARDPNRGGLEAAARSAVSIRFATYPPDGVAEADKEKYLPARMYALVGGDSSRVQLNAFDKGGPSAVHRCSGVLVDTNRVLTAGHCVSPKHLNRNPDIPFLPKIFVGGKWRVINENEIASLLDVTVNALPSTEPGNLNSINGDKTEILKSRWKARVTGISDFSFMPEQQPLRKDYAILDLAAYPQAMSAFALRTNAWRRLKPLGATKGKIIVAHAPEGELSIAEGPWLGDTTARIHYGAPTFTGSSGAGVFDGQGRLIGIHVEQGCTGLDDVWNAGVYLKDIPYSSRVALRVAHRRAAPQTAQAQRRQAQLTGP